MSRLKNQQARRLKIVSGGDGLANQDVLRPDSRRSAEIYSLDPLEVDSPTYERTHVALQLLFDAYCYAQHLGRISWDFAEEIESLQLNGLSNSDLRWLVCGGFVEHQREIVRYDQACREFESEPRLSFSANTCFVLTEKGASFVEHHSKSKPIHEVQPFEFTEVIDRNNLPNPTWSRELQELRVGEAIVKQYKVPARNQETILSVFEEEVWPIYIDDPLPRHPEIDPKRRLHDTINSLNRCQKNHLIQFRGNGSGEGIRWEFVS